MLDSKPWILDSRHRIPDFVRRTWILVSNRKLDSEFRVPKPRVPDSTSKNSPDSRIRILLRRAIQVQLIRILYISNLNQKHHL